MPLSYSCGNVDISEYQKAISDKAVTGEHSQKYQFCTRLM